VSLLVVSVGLFCVGLYGVLTRRDLVAVLASIEVMLGSATLLLVGLAAAGRTVQGAEGMVEGTGLMIVVLAAAEAAVGLALLISAARRFGTTRIDEIAEVKG